MKKGDTFKDNRTGKVYTVTKIAKDQGILLKEANSSQQIVLGQFRKPGLRDLGRSLFASPLHLLRPPDGTTC